MDGRKEPWEFLGRTQVYRSRHRGFVVERVRTHTGAEMAYGYMEAPPAVLVVPLTTDGRLVLIRQYRVPVRAWVWEVPAGGVGDAEAPAAAARRELAEEVGGTCTSLELVSWWYGLASAVNSQHHLFFASGVTLAETQHEDTELVEVVPVQPEQAFAWARTGVIRSAEGALALLLCEPLIRRLPPPAPKAP